MKSEELDCNGSQEEERRGRGRKDAKINWSIDGENCFWDEAELKEDAILQLF